jgi:hypothetical protein
MLKLSLIALFVMSMATLTIAASYMPMPPDVEAAGMRATVAMAEIG